ncbi:MAG: DUF1573 domain-containing protein [Bacteroidetes bacterium]|nr:DUF1573 domain-containing protein [Bacteroidota bacterium]
MYHKIVTVVLVVLVGTTGYLWMQNRQLHHTIDGLKTEMGEVHKAAEEAAKAKAAEPSPFDQPNNDPLSHLYGPDAKVTTSIKFDRLTHDFGRIADGSKVKTKFKFTNTGKVALIISGAQGSCGCTVPQWPRDPIKPGETGEIDVEFDSSGKSGETSKTVTVGANTDPASTVLTIKATVIPNVK